MDKLYRRLVAVLLAVVLACGTGTLGVTPATAAQTGDDGTTNWDFIVPVTHQKTMPAGYTGIYTAQDLNNIRNVNATSIGGQFILMNDIDLAGWDWIPIGYTPRMYTTGYEFSLYFTGILDGNGYKIKNLHISFDINSVADSSGCSGLFARLRGGTIKNLGIVGAISPVNVIPYIGSFSGFADKSTIENCFFSGSIAATAGIVGGLIGSLNECTISNSYNASEISITLTSTTDMSVGGLVGKASKINLNSCSNSGKIQAIKISTSVSAHTYVGGIMGSGGHIAVKNCRNSGEVYADSTGGTAIAGGIAASLDSYDPESITTNCHNSGKVAATTKSYQFSYAAGIIAQNQIAPISHCSNQGDISASVTNSGHNGSGNAEAGGITQQGSTTIRQSFNTGTISSEVNVTLTGTSYGVSAAVGGIAVETTEVIDCFNVGDLNTVSTSNKKIFHSISGIANSANISRCYSAGTQNVVSANSSDENNHGGISSTANSSRTIRDCYYLDSTAENAVGSGAPSLINVKALADTQMRQQSSFVGFDFANVWEMPAGGGYPVLRGMPGGGTVDPPQVYAVNYNTNCPYPADVSNMPAPQIKSQGQPLPLSDKIPVRTGYIFKGWGTTPTRIAPDYLAGASYTADASITLYAVWIDLSHDSDGDGLPDSWELGLVDIDGDGTIDTLLKDMGADPDKLDVFVEVDYMWYPYKTGLTESEYNAAVTDLPAQLANRSRGSVGADGKKSIEISLTPSKRQMNLVIASFAAHQINIHIDYTDINGTRSWGSLSESNEVPYQDNFKITGKGAESGYQKWQQIVDEHFMGNGRWRMLFRHAIFMDNSGTGGLVGQASNIPGHTFIVSMQDLLLYHSVNGIVLDDDTRDHLIATTFMHELGHTLGLRHGGYDDINNKSEYFSIMNYLFPIGIPKQNVTPPFSVDYSDSAVVRNDWGTLSFNWGVEGSSQIAFAVEMPGWATPSEMPEEMTIDEALGAAVEAQGLAKKQVPTPLTITNAPSGPLQYKSSVTLTASEAVTWSSDSPMVKVNPTTGAVESVRSFIKTGAAKITATSLDGQRTASIDIPIKPAWWQWLIIVVLFGWIWY